VIAAAEQTQARRNAEPNAESSDTPEIEEPTR
jgi:hypothetical protein